MPKGHGQITFEESVREDHVREVVCARCDAEVGEPCRSLWRWKHAPESVSHTSRYLVAERAGLVPPLVP